MIEPWCPLPNINDRFDLEELRDNADGLFITLTSESDRALRIDVSSPLTHRSQLRTLNEAEWARIAADSGPGTFWQVKDSSWARTCGMDQALHYLVLTSDHVVEFLTDQVPHISWLDNFFGDAV